MTALLPFDFALAFETDLGFGASAFFGLLAISYLMYSVRDRVIACLGAFS